MTRPTLLDTTLVTIHPGTTNVAMLLETTVPLPRETTEESNRQETTTVRLLTDQMEEDRSNVDFGMSMDGTLPQTQIILFFASDR